jgi:branched-subunit amino acid transport protein
MNIWLIMILAGLLTYSLRLSFIVLVGRRDISPRYLRILRYVPAAVLSAIIFPETLYPDGMLELTIANPRLPAALLAALVAWRTRSVVLTILVGVAALIAFQAINPF